MIFNKNVAIINLKFKIFLKKQLLQFEDNYKEKNKEKYDNNLF